MPTDDVKLTIEIMDRHVPQLGSGDYRLEVTTHIRSTVDVHKGYAFVCGDESEPETTRHFSVLGPRFSLTAREIHGVFPPQNGLDNYAAVLPHIVIERSTLPWERSPDAKADTTTGEAIAEPSAAGAKDAEDAGAASWLAVLLLDEDEEAKKVTVPHQSKGGASPVQTMTLANLRGTADRQFPTPTIEQGDRDDDNVTVIDIKADFLKCIVPTRTELRLLSHVRQRHREPGPHKVPDEAGDYAVVVANRLPVQGKRHSAYLVSLEGRYKGEVFELDVTGADVRLVVLKRWQFTCARGDSRNSAFINTLKALEYGPLRLPSCESAEAEHYLGRGFVPLRQRRVDATPALAWYHGPFLNATTPAGAAPDNRVQRAIQLLRRSPDTGIEDVSYAAAWELGRLLTLRNRDAAIDLYNWKRCCHQEACHADTCEQHAHLPCTSPKRHHAFPEDWFRSLANLTPLPFQYLVPDERALPPESIRFFQVDRAWIECLLHGAFSIGTTTSSEHRSLVDARRAALDALPQAQNGLLLRSELVSGYPRMQVVANDAALRPAVMRKLSDSLMLCLFDKPIGSVQFYLPPEAVHFDVGEHADQLREFISRYHSSAELAAAVLHDIAKVSFELS